MIRDIPTFDRGALGEISIRLQGCCDSCPRAPSCPLDTGCPVRAAGRLLSKFLTDGEQVLKPEELLSKLTALPPGARPSEDEAHEILKQIQSVCNRCMFHVEQCAMNELYALVEIAMGRADRKPGSTKPGNDSLRG